ncbi:DUF4921 family protein [Nitrosophilus alvini]|uniref:galactose-1-phosphate uridylyltransferase n=1 Tax=Nitrosophilus alvini TaxID=2714855 RepID=UPI00190AF107|nr:DUF4921 family protein [Nitrosophilus alvini]
MPDIRYDPLKNRYSVFSPQRALRPHAGYAKKREKRDYISPFEWGNEHMTPPEIFAIRDDDSRPDTPGWKIRVIPNAYSALEKSENHKKERECIYLHMGGYGYHEIVVETPDKFKQFEDFTIDEVSLLFWVFQKRASFLYTDKNIEYVQIFKNCGEEAGSSILHSHSQIIALPYIPSLTKRMLFQSKEYFSKFGKCLLCDEVECETGEKKRVVYENEKYIVYSPYASFFPYEMRVVSKLHSSDFIKIEKKSLDMLSDAVLSAIVALRRSIADVSYNIIMHILPKSEKDAYKFFHWHVEIVPRLNVWGGFEIGSGSAINSVLPEEAARELKTFARI